MRFGRSNGSWAKAPEGWAHSRTLSRGRRIAGAGNLAGLGMAAGCQPAIQPIANRRYSRTLRADRGGVAHWKLQGFRKFLGAPPLPGPLLHFEEWRRGGHGVLDGVGFRRVGRHANGLVKRMVANHNQCRTSQALPVQTPTRPPQAIATGKIIYNRKNGRKTTVCNARLWILELRLNPNPVTA